MARSDTFALDVSRFVEKAKGRTDLVVRKVTLDVFRRVVKRSPVDTGRFRGNWQLGVGSIPTSRLPTLDKTGDATVAEIARGVANIVAGGIVYLANNLPYARRLEYGWSQQAPSGMVRVTIVEYQTAVQRAAREARTEMP